jgi:four helix bundle protein
MKTNQDLKKRTKRFALDVIRFVEGLPKGMTCEVLGRQLLRAGTSVGANYRAACRAKSTADFISKMGNVEEEADECGYWMELLVEDGKIRLDCAAPLLREANELLAITIASINTARTNTRATARSIPHSALRTPHS